MKLGVCTTSRNASAVRDAGFQTIGLSGRELSSLTPATAAELRRTLADLGLETCSANAFCPPELALLGPGCDPARVREYTRRVCQGASELGITSIGIGSPKSRTILPTLPRRKALSEFAGSLCCIAAVAQEFEMDVLLEPLAVCECNCVNTAKEGLAILSQCNEPNLHLVYDLYHASLMQEDPSEIFALLPEIRCVHLSGPLTDLAAAGHAYLDAIQMQPLTPYLRALTAAGYHGELLLEAFSGEFSSGLVSSYLQMRPWGSDTGPGQV